MKLVLALILISANISFAQLKFNGGANYFQQDNKHLTSTNSLEHIFKIYEDHRYIISISNASTVDLDCFKNEIKETNIFTTLKIEF
jgi:hypothetical protein